MELEIFTFNPFATNCFLLEDNGQIAVVDPSCQSEQEVAELLDAVAALGGNVTSLLLTHAHIDHIFGCKALFEAFGLSFGLHPEDVPLFQNGPTQAAMFGVPLDVEGVPLAALEPGTTITVGSVSLDIVHTPGHSPGSVSFVDRANRYVIAGDVLFEGSIGRTDLWRGSIHVLLESINSKLMVLEDDFTVYPGHGPATTIGRERASNPFLQD